MCFPENTEEDVGVGVKHAKGPEEDRPPPFPVTQQVKKNDRTLAVGPLNPFDPSSGYTRSQC